jgi:hypothetical protein
MKSRKWGNAMNLKFKFWLSALLMVGQTATADGGGMTKPPKSPSPKQEAIITVPYCDLVRNQAKYAGQLVRVRAIVLGWLDGTSLYDSACKKRGLEPVFDCKDEERCSAMRKTLQEKMDYNGDAGRVEAVLIGSLVVPPETPTGKSRSKFMIKRIEQTKRVSPDVPWPG